MPKASLNLQCFKVLIFEMLYLMVLNLETQIPTLLLSYHLKKNFVKDFFK
jgi:hypothetical protein